MHKTRLLEGKFVLVFNDPSTKNQPDIYLKNIHPVQFSNKIIEGMGMKQDIRSINEIIAVVGKEYPNLHFSGVAVLEQVEYVTLIPANQYAVIENLNTC